MIREIRLEDAESIRSVIAQVEAESEFMLMGAGERQTSLEQQEKMIMEMKKQKHSTIFVADEGGRLVGYAFVIGSRAERVKHSAYLVIGILAEFRGRGIGTVLFRSIEEWAAARGLSRLELTVVIENEAAIALYRKCGYEVEGIKRQSLKINDRLYDQYYMAKLIGVPVRKICN